MSIFSRTDTSVLGQWWWTIDRWTLAALTALVAIGAVLTMAASPAVAERIGLNAFHFVNRQFLFLLMALAVIFVVSLLNPRSVRLLAAACLVLSLIAMAATLVVGVEIKGAARWLDLGGFSFQPSEFVKPGFAVIAAWMFSRGRIDRNYPGYMISIGLFALIVALLLLQPDVGMTIVIAVVWGVQFFLAGLPLALVALVSLLFLGGGAAAYYVFPHVQVRVDRFLDPSVGEGYQVARSLEAFRSGGLFGLGPGEGHVKEVLPDAHADFIFAVAGEEFGLIACLIIIGIFLFIILRGFSRIFGDDDLFSLLAVAGLLVQFSLQAIINIASTINLMPPKGMTLPFISYGGSSTLALALAMGMVLALTRERTGRESKGWMI